MAVLSALFAVAALASPGYVSALIKLRPGAAVKAAPTATLQVARGECEAVQVHIPPPRRQVDARLPPLRGPQSHLAVKLYREAYVEVRQPSNLQGATGLWPDPLIPVVDDFAHQKRNALPFDSTEERPLILYLEVCVPVAQLPGKYQGTLTLSAAGERDRRLPLTVEVQPFALPATSSLPNSFGLSIYSLAKGHHLDPASPQARQLLHDYAAALLSHRLSAYGMGIDPPPVSFEGGKASVDFAGYDAELAPFLDGTALASGARFTTTDVRDSRKAVTDDEKAAYYQAFREHFAEKGWKTRLFFYAKDEPKPEDYPLVRIQSKRVHQAGGIPVLLTASLQQALRGAGDILCPNLNCFFPRAGAQTCSKVMPAEVLRQRLEPGHELWWYQSCSSHGCSEKRSADPEIEKAYAGWASYMVDQSVPSNRAMGALAFAEQIGGELYFDTVFAYNRQDPWGSVFAFGGNGDGTLFYPGDPSRIGGTRPVPVTSLRLATVRDGLEDYEYLALLSKLGDEPLARASARQLARSGYDISQRPEEWESVRQKLTSRLVELWNASEYRDGPGVGR